MYIISFDLNIAELKKTFGEYYPRALDEVREKLEKVGFKWTVKSIYMDEDPENHITSSYTNKDTKNGLTAIYKSINMLAEIQWFKESVSSLKAFQIQDWSDFTEVVKGL